MAKLFKYLVLAFISCLLLLFGGPVGVVLVVLIVLGSVGNEMKERREIFAIQGIEMQCSCDACGSLWCYGEPEVRNKHKYKNFEQCPRCGSRRIRKRPMALKD